MTAPTPALALVATLVVATACTAQQPTSNLVSGSPAEFKGFRAVTVLDGLDRPWGIAWLPGGRALVTEKGGRLWSVDLTAKQKTEVTGLPGVFSRGQGGLMDVALHPDFATNSLVYFTLSEGTGEANRTALVRGKLEGRRLSNVQTLFRVSQQKSGGQHFGSRLLWLPDKTLLMSIGDGGNPPTSLNGENIRNQAQSTASHLGKVLRLTADGKPAPGNPFAGRNGAAAEVWSLGHRNIQGMARDPQSGRVYVNEHGAKGGDEVNVVEKGKNYGWPLVTWSTEYWGPKISDLTTKSGMVDPIVVWTPCPAPSGLAFVTGDRYPAWRGDLLSGGLAGNDVRRVDLDANGKVLGQQRLVIGDRVRDVRQGPDGWVYVLTDEQNGRLLRIELTR